MKILTLASLIAIIESYWQEMLDITFANDPS
jgi:hypothetical protein